ncbi:preprotein translocase subunit SecY [Gallicola sp. Sow4_E12]|uniref:preprotein translocase subunit SecY n=1 Tax=Gallicola sp. Sow4_E12 TaxID=3438785 RepID=UPI003F8FAFDB
MFETIRKAWAVAELRQRMIFTLLMVGVFRLGNAIPVPFMNKEMVSQVMGGAGQTGILNLLNLLSGNSLSQMSIFALSIYPFITASIIIQLLTVAIPRLQEIARDGEMGKKKIGKYTKIGAVILGFIEGYAIVNGLFSQAIVQQSMFSGFVILLSMVAGSMFLIWLGEMITAKGVGNGISIIIFLGIISGLPGQIGNIWRQFQTGLIQWWQILILLIIVIFVLWVVVMVNEGERKIPVQYAKRVVGRKMYGGQSTHIPVKVNMAGVMPVIFASSILQLPNTIALLFGTDMPNWVQNIFTVETTSGLIIYAIINLLLIILFAYFYTAIQFNPVEYAKNLQQYGGFIPGIRPGKSTGEYLQRISNRITFIGALSLALVSSGPMLLAKVLGVEIVFGGTAIIIVVGVILDTLKQMDSMLTMRHYKGFLK